MQIIYQNIVLFFTYFTLLLIIVPLLFSYLGINDGGSMCYFLENPNSHKEISYQGGKQGLHGMGFDGNYYNYYIN